MHAFLSIACKYAPQKIFLHFSWAQFAFNCCLIEVVSNLKIIPLIISDYIQFKAFYRKNVISFDKKNSLTTNLFLPRSSIFQLIFQLIKIVDQSNAFTQQCCKPATGGWLWLSADSLKTWAVEHSIKCSFLSSVHVPIAF